VQAGRAAVVVLQTARQQPEAPGVREITEAAMAALARRHSLQAVAVVRAQSAVTLRVPPWRATAVLAYQIQLQEPL
jgi:hypothetical protein